MIKIDNWDAVGWEHAIRGMRNPMNSWDKSDSVNCDARICRECPVGVTVPCLCNEDGVFGVECNGMFVDGGRSGYAIGPNDQALMKGLAAAGPVHAKYRRMITVYVDITAPLYWWKEFDTYKVGTVANSCSTMHKIHSKEFEIGDFSHEHLVTSFGETYEAMDCLNDIIACLNKYRQRYIETNAKHWWWQMVQLLPSSYNQKRTIMFNYEVLANIYKHRKDHKLDEWKAFCEWIENLPFAQLIVGDQSN